METTFITKGTQQTSNKGKTAHQGNMMHFRKKSSISNTSDHDGANRASDVKISEDDKARLKMRTASVADPILDAVQEAQPFEQAADTFHDNMNRQSKRI